jgi:hypothetical protein
VTALHCVGCSEHGNGAHAACPGAPVPDGVRLKIVNYLADLPWRSRIKILLGIPVRMELDIEATRFRVPGGDTPAAGGGILDFGTISLGSGGSWQGPQS